MTTSREQQDWLAHLEQLHSQILTQTNAGKVDLTRLREISDTKAYLAFVLEPMPIDPTAHVIAAHAQARPYLKQLCHRDPNIVVAAGNTEYGYTPRKVLRRVLDHALDHLNQIDQWLAWQQYGNIPTPTDGWASSATTLHEDTLPLTEIDLQAWLWRIDLTIDLVARRAAQLTTEQLDWTPPDGGWSLRTMLHHLATGEGFYAIWVGLALPGDPIERYVTASQQFRERLRRALNMPISPNTAFFATSFIAEETYLTVEHIAQRAIQIEEEIVM